MTSMIFMVFMVYLQTFVVEYLLFIDLKSSLIRPPIAPVVTQPTITRAVEFLVSLFNGAIDRTIFFPVPGLCSLFARARML